MANEALLKIKDLSKSEVIEKMRSGEVVPPSKGTKDRDQFFSFVGMTQEERDAFLSDGAPGASTAPDNGDPVAGDLPAAPEPDPVGDPPAPSDDALHKRLGFDSEEKASEAYKAMMENQSRLQAQIDSLNARGGRNGQQVKGLVAENDTLKKELEGLRASSPSLQRPVRPKRPNPTEFPDGNLDEGYLGAIEKYDSDIELYDVAARKFDKNDLMREVSAKIPAPSASPVFNEQVETQKAWDSFWGATIPEFQVRIGLQTSIPVKRISDAFTALDPNNKRATPTDRVIAENFLKSIPKVDMENYNKVKIAVDASHTFDDGVPSSQYRTIEGALYDRGLMGEGSMFSTAPASQVAPASEQPRTPTAREIDEEARRKAQEQNQQHVATPPASASAGSDRPGSDGQTTDEEKRIYLGLLREYNAACQYPDQRTSFERGDRYRDMIRLRQKLGFKSAAVVQKG